MCGIAGILAYQESGRADPSLLAKMVSSLAHRGPDGDGQWVSDDQSVGLGHRRLSIIDLSSLASQPMTNEDGSVVLSFNGEIYNHAALRSDLLASGHHFKTDHSDTEVILHGYEQWGYDVLKHLDGMFAFALWDSRNAQLFLARDRIGIKPLYYAQRPDRLLFASEVKAILQDPTVPRTPSPDAVVHYLSFVSSPAPQTLFKDILKLPCGHYMTIDRKGRTQVNRYYCPIVESSSSMSEREAQEEYLRLLRAAISKRMIADVPFGVFLSGGLDSSTNVAVMSDLMDRPVETFSVGFKDNNQSPYDELAIARLVANHFGANHHEIQLGDHDFTQFLENMAYLQDEPVADPVCVPLYYVSKLARHHDVPVIQVGEGADELFCGYDAWVKLTRFYRQLWRPFQQMPDWVKWATHAIARPILNDYKLEFVRRAAASQEMFWGTSIYMTEGGKERLVREEILDGRSSHDVVQRNLSLLYAAKEPRLLEKMAYVDLQHRLPESILMRMDKMTMANSIEARVPFLDRELVEFALAIPDTLKTDGRSGKLLPRNAMASILPKEITSRPKIGFCGGAHNMMTDGIFQFARNVILEDKPGWDHFFRKDQLELLLAENSLADRAKTWALMTLALWWKTWIV